MIVGDGPAKAPLEKKYGGSAIFTGYKKGEELVDLLLVSDVFVFPSKTDTFGLTIIEALACGLPVVTGASGGVTEIVTHDRSGILFEPGDIETQARAFLAIANDPELRARLRAGALADARRYSADRSRARLREIIERHLL